MIALEPGTDLEALRARMRNMTDADLVQFGKDCVFLCRPAFGKPPRDVWVLQFQEARAEWRRRYPKG